MREMDRRMNRTLRMSAVGVMVECDLASWLPRCRSFQVAGVRTLAGWESHYEPAST